MLIVIATAPWMLSNSGNSAHTPASLLAASVASAVATFTLLFLVLKCFLKWSYLLTSMTIVDLMNAFKN